MPFPDQIERTLELAHPPQAVWGALTTAEGLSAWFGERATIDLREGGDAQMTFSNGLTVDMSVGVVEEPHRFGYTWKLPDLPADDPRRTYVEFLLEATSTGTRLRVTETGFAQLSIDLRRATYDGHAEGWTSELGELTAYLDGR